MVSLLSMVAGDPSTDTMMPWLVWNHVSGLSVLGWPVCLGSARCCIRSRTFTCGVFRITTQLLTVVGHVLVFRLRLRLMGGGSVWHCIFLSETRMASAPQNGSAGHPVDGVGVTLGGDTVAARPISSPKRNVGELAWIVRPHRFDSNDGGCESVGIVCPSRWVGIPNLLGLETMCCPCHSGETDQPRNVDSGFGNVDESLPYVDQFTIKSPTPCKTPQVESQVCVHLCGEPRPPWIVLHFHGFPWKL